MTIDLNKMVAQLQLIHQYSAAEDGSSLTTSHYKVNDVKLSVRTIVSNSGYLFTFVIDDCITIGYVAVVRAPIVDTNFNYNDAFIKVDVDEILIQFAPAIAQHASTIGACIAKTPSEAAIVMQNTLMKLRSHTVAITNTE